MTDWKQVRDEAAKSCGDGKAVPIIRSMYPSTSRGEMSKQFQQVFCEGYDYAIANDPRVKAARRLVELQQKLLMCCRIGKPPGKWLDEMESLREALKAFEGSGE